MLHNLQWVRQLLLSGNYCHMFTSRAFRLSAHALIWADPSLTLTSTALVKADIRQIQYKQDFLGNQSWPVLNGDLTFGGLSEDKIRR